MLLQTGNRRAKLSKIECLALRPESERRRILAGLTESQFEDLAWDWRFHARPEQLRPGTPGADLDRKDWRFWVVKAGRGFGKTRVGGETCREWAEDPKARILMVAPTSS